MVTATAHTRSWSRRWFLERAAAGGAAMALGTAAQRDAATAGGPAGYPPLNHAVIGERAHLSIWLTPELAQQSAYQRALALFQSAYPGITVSVTPVAEDDMLTRYKLAATGGGAGVAPDLVAHHGYIFGAQGLAHESDALWSAYDRQGDFLPPALADVQWRVDKFGIPLVLNPVVTILNADMFRKARVPLPTRRTTFAEFTQLIAVVRRANGSRYGMILSADGATVTAAVHANGGELITTVQGRNIARLSDSRVVDAVRYYTQLGWRDRLAPLPPTGSSNRLYIATLFAARQAPAFFGTISDIALIQRADPQIAIAVAPLPGGTSGRTTGSVSRGLSMVLTGVTRKPHAAFELAKWMVAEPVAFAVAQSMHLAPTIGSYYNAPLYHRDQTTATYYAAAQTAGRIGLDAYTEPYDLYLGAVRSAFGGGDAGKLLSAIQGRAQEAMDKADAGIESDG